MYLKITPYAVVPRPSSTVLRTYFHFRIHMMHTWDMGVREIILLITYVLDLLAWMPLQNLIAKLCALINNLLRVKERKTTR